MLWCNDIVKFIVDKALELGVQTYFYTGDKETYSFFSSYVNKEIIIILREEIAKYLSMMGKHYELKVKGIEDGFAVTLKERCE